MITGRSPKPCIDSFTRATPAALSWSIGPATLTAADFSANDQLARLIGETDFNTLFHQGEKESMYLADVARRVILVVLFDNRTTLGLVRLKMKMAVDDLTKLFEQVFARGQSVEGVEQPNILSGADDEIDRLFQ
jgi:Roadblock/LC7 domain